MKTFDIETFDPDSTTPPTIQCYLDDVLLGERLASPYQFEAPSPNLGGHLIHINVTDEGGILPQDHVHFVIEPAKLANHLQLTEGNPLQRGFLVSDRVYWTYGNGVIRSSSAGHKWVEAAYPAGHTRQGDPQLPAKRVNPRQGGQKVAVGEAHGLRFGRDGHPGRGARSSWNSCAPAGAPCLRFRPTPGFTRGYVLGPLRG